MHVSQNFLPFLGAHPILGRQFNTEECQWNGPKAALYRVEGAFSAKREEPKMAR